MAGMARLLATRVTWRRLRWLVAWFSDGLPPAGPHAPADAPVGRGRATSGGAPDPGDLVAAAYDEFQREIHAFTTHSMRDPEAAADVTQEAFVRLLREAQAGRTPDNVRAWLYRVCSNLVINRARHARVADAFRRAWSGGEDVEDSPEWAALRSERTAELRSELGRLSNDARIGLLLAANGFSGKEIAEQIGRTELATRTLLCRARIQLRERLAAGEAPA